MQLRRLRKRSVPGILLSAVLSLPVIAGATPATARFSAPTARVDVALTGGLPVGWLYCRPACDAPDAAVQSLIDNGGNGHFAWTGDDTGLVAAMTNAVYVVVADGPDIELHSTAHIAGRERIHRYHWDADRQALQLTLDLPDGIGLRVGTGPAFVPEALPGFAAVYTDVRAVIVDHDGQRGIGEPDQPTAGPESLLADTWAGIRTQFWAILLRPETAAQIVRELPAANQPQLSFDFSTHKPVVLELAAGPVERGVLKRIDPVLTGMLFAALWDWLRALCFGMLWLLESLHALVGNEGLAIMLLSLSVKILMYPLTRIADRWQQDVNRIQARLQPALAGIKAKYKGEEAHNRVLAVYREHGVHPMFTLKSLAGFLIQIPVFIAAFDMLGGNFALYQAPFLWIDDLSKPDRFMALPFELPFFGGYLNLLPFLMTGLTLLASAIQAEPALTESLRRQQRLRLYAMAAVFFILFYTFPAGMVLYWMTNNLLHLLKILPQAIRERG